MTRKKADLIPTELRAIERNRQYLSQLEGREVSLDEAIANFIIHYESDFLTRKQLRDCVQQSEEILKYKWIESEKQGHDIGPERAAAEWINKYGSLWRAEKESLERNGFLRTDITIPQECGTTVEMARIADIARSYNCEVYLHRQDMKRYNFILFGKKKYLNVKSIVCPKYLAFSKDEQVELIATGANAARVLEEIVRFLKN